MRGKRGMRIVDCGSSKVVLPNRSAQSQCPDYVHQIVDFASDGGSARIQVVLHTESGKKSQDQFRQGVRIHLWALDLNILGDELL
jgi:hypothetical protein